MFPLMCFPEFHAIVRLYPVHALNDLKDLGKLHVSAVLKLSPIHTHITSRLFLVRALIELVGFGDHKLSLVDGLLDVVSVKL